MDEKAEEARKDENRIRATIERRKREIERLTTELYNLRQKKKRRTVKRKRIQEERQDLRKKLVCCETLIKTVPKDT
jgi:chromosome segregation ATPase